MEFIKSLFCAPVIVVVAFIAIMVITA